MQNIIRETVWARHIFTAHMVIFVREIPNRGDTVSLLMYQEVVVGAGNVA
jgi:hypothetical protein